VGRPRCDTDTVKLAAAFALPLVLAFTLVRTATHVVGVPQTPANAQKTSIVWANRVFVTRRELARWLHARGASYARWAQKHPGLASGRAPAADAGLAQVDRNRAVRLLRSLVLGVAIAALALAALAPIAHRVRRQRSRIYVPAVAGYRRWPLDGPLRALVRTRTGSGPAIPASGSAVRRYGTPVFQRDRARRADLFLRRGGGWYVAASIVGAALGALLGYALS
jgi:hypothetical protein